jgi:hypothetical protein
MNNSKVYSLCEAFGDSAYIAAKENTCINNNREMIGQFIEWAKEFEYLLRYIEW